MTSEAALAKLSYVLGLPGLSLDGRKEVCVPPAGTAPLGSSVVGGPSPGIMCLGFAGGWKWPPRHLPQAPHRPTLSWGAPHPTLFLGEPQVRPAFRVSPPQCFPGWPLRLGGGHQGPGRP